MQISRKFIAPCRIAIVSAMVLIGTLSGFAQNPFEVNAPITAMEKRAENAPDQISPETTGSDKKSPTPGKLPDWVNSIVKIVTDLFTPDKTDGKGVSKHIARSIQESKKSKTAVGKRSALIEASYRAKSLADIDALMRCTKEAADREEIIRHAINVVKTPQDIIKLAIQTGSEYSEAYVYVDWANKQARTPTEIEMLAKVIKSDMRGNLAVAGARKCKTFSEFKRMYELAKGDAEDMAAVCRLGAGTAGSLSEVLRYSALATTRDSKNWIVVTDGLKYAKTVEDLQLLIAATGNHEGLRWLQVEAAKDPLFADYILTTLDTELEKSAFTKMCAAYKDYYETLQSHQKPREAVEKQDFYENAKSFFQTMQ